MTTLAAYSITVVSGEDDVTPDTVNYANISGADSAETTDEQWTGFDIAIDIYHTQTYNTGSLATVETSINQGSYTIWSPGSGNTISISPGDDLQIRVQSVSEDIDVDINIYNASDGNAFVDGFNADVTYSK